MQPPSYSVPLEQGAPFVLRPANPAAGASLTIPVPAHARWRFEHVRFTLATAVGGAVRTPTFRANDATGVFAQLEPNGTQAASLTRTWHFMAQESFIIFTSGANIYTPMPPRFVLLPGMDLQILIQTIQAGDQISDVLTYGRQWAERSE